MRAILTTDYHWFSMLAFMRGILGDDRVIIRDNARYPADGDWELWQDEGEAVG